MQPGSLHQVTLGVGGSPAALGMENKDSGRVTGKTGSPGDGQQPTQRWGGT